MKYLSIYVFKYYIIMNGNDINLQQWKYYFNDGHNPSQQNNQIRVYLFYSGIII